MNPKLRMLLLPLCLAAFVFNGCSEDEGGVGSSTPTYPDPIQPDILIANFARAYTERSIVEYDELLHAELQFFFADDDVTQLGLEEPSWDRVTELAATRRMFGNQSGVDPVTGSTIPPISDFAIALTPESASWGFPPADPLFEGSSMRIYRAFMSVTYQGQEPQAVGGQQEFYVENVAGDGETPNFRLKFWRDRGTALGGGGLSGRTVDTQSWGAVKAGFGN